MMTHSAENSEPSVKVAMCQIFALDGDREGNYVRLEAALQQAVDQGAEIVCFPETCLLGWVNPTAHQRAQPIPGRDSQRLADLAGKHHVFVCVGLAEKDGDQLFDSAILIDDQGQLLLKHRKINTLQQLMDPPYSRGEAVQTVDTRFGRIGVLICADSFDETVVQRMKKLEPDLVLIPYGWAAPEEKWPQHGEKLKACVSHAARTIAATIVGTDLVGQISHGPWRGMIYGGQSVAANAQGKVLAMAKDRQQDVVVIRVAKPVAPG